MFIPDLDNLLLSPEGDEHLEELGRHTLSEGPWATVAYLVRSRPSEETPWEGPLLWLHRYQRVREGWKLVSRFRTTDSDQLARLIQAFRSWDLIEPQDRMLDGES